MSDAPTADQLLADAAWLKRLAITLAGNEDDADDLVQQSWIAAWQRGPDTSRPLRPWLAKVIRDLAGMRRRSDRRRELREQAIEDRGAPAGPDALLAQMRLHRLVVDLVLELDEPYRSTIIARFVEGRTAVAIARSLGIPDSTVRARLHEALSRLRAQLDAKTGERKAWAPAVIAFAQRGIQVAKPIKSIAWLVALLALLLATAVTIVVVVRPRTVIAGLARVEPKPVGATPTTEIVATRTPGWIAQDGASSKRIAGRVLDDGTPVAGALVRLASEPTLAGLIPTPEQRTDGDGRFDFGIQAPRPYAVTAAAAGKLAAIEHVDLRDRRATDSLVLVLSACSAALYGTITDSTGTPIPHAQLLREDLVGGETDASGAYELCTRPHGLTRRELEIVVRAPGFGAITAAIAPVGRTHRDFAMTPEAVIAGRAVTATGAAVASAEIEVELDAPVTRPGAERQATAVAACDADGHFRLAGLGAGRYFVGGRGVAAIAVQIAGGETKDIVVTIAATGVVRGRILRGNEPVAGIHVVATGADAGDAVSQPDGSFVLDRVPLGDVELSTWPDRVRAPAKTHITSGDNAVTLEVEALASVSGTIRRHGEPIARARIVIYGAHGPPNRATYADDTGHYALDGFEPGDFTAQADSLEAFADTQTFSLALGERRQLDIELSKSARITGSVVDATGAPVSAVHVVFEHTDPRSHAAYDLGRCTTDERGHFDCASLAGGGAYRAAVFPATDTTVPFHFVVEPAPVTVADGESRVDDIRLVIDATRLSIRGVVVDPTGAGVADVRVSIVGDGAALASVPTTITSPTGALELSGLAAGRYDLLAERSDGTRTVARGIAAGTTVSIVLDGPACIATHDISPAHRPRARIAWDDKIELVGWDMPDTVHLGDSIDVAVYYRVLQPIDRSWKTFAHFDLPKQARVNADHDPLGGRCPTSAWHAGDILVDRFTTRVADPAGAYQVWIGFFRGSVNNWIDMPISDAPSELRDDTYHRILLAKLAVEP